MIAFISFTGVPVPPVNRLYSEDGFVYSISSFGPQPPLSPTLQFVWRKTGPDTGTLVETTGSFRTERTITFSSFSPQFGWSGVHREGSLSGFIRFAPFALTSGAPLRNTSTRLTLGSGGMATMGFVVAGATPRRVLVRAIGPSLAQFGVASPAAAPALTVLRSGAEIGTNSGWGGAPDLAAVFAKVGAFALPTSSRDCALVLTLAAGNYTAQVRADGGGEVLFEVYFVD
ncbi:MAG: hypothetical protein JNL39_06550 [Opitutaceae bacterium]|nr:hypothetical protein [Opitutaceae bacterium]